MYLIWTPKFLQAGKVGIGLHDTWSHTYSHVCGNGFRTVVVCFGKLSTDPCQTMFALSSYPNAIAVCAMQVNKSVAEYKVIALLLQTSSFNLAIVDLSPIIHSRFQLQDCFSVEAKIYFM